MRLPSLLSLISVSAGCYLDYELGEPDTGTPPVDELPIDLDEDGVTEDEGDCDDNDPLRSPLRGEDCDGLDNNCDGFIDITLTEGGQTPENAKDDRRINACHREFPFQQSTQADVLLVLDVSPSMQLDPDGLGPLKSNWTRTAEGAAAMLEHLVGGKPYDTHIGVITSDMETETGGGRLVNATIDNVNRRFVDGVMDHADAALWMSWAITDRFPLEVDKEEGIRSSILASMEDHLGGANAGFFRPGTPLDIIVVSNEEDDSEPDSHSLVQELQAYSNSSGSNVRIHTIVQMAAPACHGLSDTPSLRLLHQMTAGLILDVCSSDYTGFMSGLGQIIAERGLNDRIRLPGPAQEIDIFIQEGPSEAKWVGEVGLSEDRRTIYFIDPIPPAGTNILVRYLAEPTPPER